MVFHARLPDYGSIVGSSVSFLENVCFDTSDDLAAVTRTMKKIVILNGLVKDKWTDEHDDAIFRYLIDTKLNLLVCYIYVDDLYVQFDIPRKPVNELFYFIKKTSERITTANFSSTVQFGTAKAPYIECLFQTMFKVYAPMFLNESEWSECVKSQLPPHLSKCLERIFSARNIVLKQRILYVPKNISKYSMEEVIENRELVSQVEDIVMTWLNIMRTSLEAQDTTQNFEDGPVEELEFWKKKGIEYSEIIEQLKGKEVQSCLEILKATHSSFLHQYNLLHESIQETDLIASENVKLLSILKEPCESFENDKLQNTADHMKKILNLMRIIFRKSSYYNTNTHICILLRKVSNLLIKICRKEMNVEEMLENPTFTANSEVLKEIACCATWKEIYTFSEKVHSIHSPVNWKVDDIGIFAPVDAFVLRCKNLLEVFKYKSRFHIDDSSEDQPCNVLRGEKGKRVYRLLKSSEQSFLLLLQNLAKAKNHALDVQATTWNDHFSLFKMEVQNLEISTAKSLSFAFEDLLLIEEGLEILKVANKFAEQEIVKKIFHSYATELYDMFLSDINSIKMEVLKKNTIKSSIQPLYSGTAYTTSIVVSRLKRAFKALEDSDFLPTSDYRNNLMLDYHTVVDVIEELSFSLFLNWSKDLPKDPQRYLSSSIFYRNSINPEAIDLNLHRNIITLIQELAYWEKKHTEIPSSLTVISKKCDDYMRLQKKAMFLLREYNKIIIKLSKFELNLFRPILSHLNEKYLYGFTRITWISPRGMLAFMKDCRFQCLVTAKLLEWYRNSNVIILKVCEDISCQNLFEKDICYPLEFSDFILLQHDHCEARKLDLLELYNKVISEVSNVLNILVEEASDPSLAVFKYVENVNALLKTAVRKLFTSSLEDICSLFGSTRKSRVKAILKIKLTLKDRQMTFDPSAVEIIATLKNIMQKMIAVLSNIKQIQISTSCHPCPGSSIYSPDEAFNDAEKYIKILRHGLIELKMSLVSYFDTWKPYAHLWITSKSSVLQFYQSGQWTAKNFEDDIIRFLTSGKDAQMIDQYKMIEFCIMDCAPLKNAAHQCAQDWKNLLGSILREISCRSLQNATNFLFMTSEKFAKEPQSLNELKHCIDFLKSAKKISQRILPTIVPMYKNFCVLKKFDLIPDYKTYYQLCHLKEKWYELEKTFKKEHVKLQKIQAEFQRHFITFGVELGNRAQIVLDYFMENGPFANNYLYKKAFKQIKKSEMELSHLQETEKSMQKDSFFFNMTLEPLQSVVAFENVLIDIKEAWTYVKQYLDFLKFWENEHVLQFDVPPKLEKAKVLHKKCISLKAKVRDPKWVVLTDLIAKLKELQAYFHVIEYLQNQTLQERHWDEIKKHLNLEFEPSSEKFTLKYLQTLNIEDMFAKIEAISIKATNEFAIEQGIKEIKKNCQVLDLVMEGHKDYYQLMKADEFLAIIEDNQMSLGAIKASKYVKYFAEEVDDLECSLSLMQEVVDLAQLFQRRHFYLENIFGAEAIRQQLPKETVEFDSVSSKWQDITKLMNNVKNAWDVSHEPGIVPTLLHLNQKLEDVQYSLDSYLETKRRAFPRFYFISNDDLLSILGQAQNPFAIQPHLKKCFDNIVMLEFGQEENVEFPLALGMHSDDGEYVAFDEPVIMAGFIESWLHDVETAMQDSLRILLKYSLENFDSIQHMAIPIFSELIKSLPGQVCWMGLQIAWTTDVSKSIKMVQESGVINALKHSKKKWKQILQKISNESEISSRNAHEKFMAMILTLVHARDVLDMLLQYICNDIEAFEWLRQLRFYFFTEDGDKCVVKQTTAEFSYAYEYLGNRRRLVITPLTDRCYLTLTTALHLSQGVCLKGTSGCGKTETVKDLGKALGCYVLIINCSEGLDFKSLGRMLSGLAQIGAWCSFDEFNRINVEVLSVVAMRILNIFQALKAQKERFVFDGNEIPLRQSCGIFITINPVYYTGRSELPYNLVYMFRPLSMMVPDVQNVAEIILYANGFQESKLLAQKIQSVFSIAAIQVSPQFHYDFGLRAIIQVLRCAMHTKQKHEDLTEEEVIFSSIHEVTIPKMHSVDLPIFKGIMTDVFGDLRLTVEYPDVLKRAVEETLKTSVLQKSGTTLTKVLQFYQTKFFHHAIILIGGTGSGKSTTWKTLKGASCLLADWGETAFFPVQVSQFNPKAVTLPEVFGELDVETGDWKDGILSSLVRTACSDTKPFDKWILFDGPADAQWVESMNSLMDDNRILTLINGERIVLSPRVTLVFEVTNLSHCSPATVSRCGVVYHDYEALGWKPFFDSWLEKKPQIAVKQELETLCNKYLKPMLAFKRRHEYEFLPLSELNAVISFCRLYETFLPQTIVISSDPDEEVPNLMLDEWFIFSLIWAIGGNASVTGRMKIDTFFRDTYGLLPQHGTVYDFYVHPEKGWTAWKDLLTDVWNHKQIARNVLVPTKDTLSYEFVASALLNYGYPVLFVGDIGTGKTLVGNYILRNLDESVFETLSINMSVQSTSCLLQNLIEARLRKKSRGLFLPASGRKMVTFIDDFNMPAIDKYGIQSPLELIRMWIDHGFWYDRTKVAIKNVQNMVLFAAMGPPGGSRHQISSQLQNRFNVLNIISPQEPELFRIFSTMLKQQYFDMRNDIRQLVGIMTQTVLNIYKSVASVFLPTPSKIHYIFSLSDIAKVVQGLLLVDKNSMDSRTTMIRYFCHECHRVFSDRLINNVDKKEFYELLNREITESFNLTLKQIYDNAEPSIFVKIFNIDGTYREVKNFELLNTNFSNAINTYNQERSSGHLDMVLFESALHHACRISRGIGQPGGNMLLIGSVGSGRQCLCELVAYALNYSMFQINISKDYSLTEFRDDLKSLLQLVGVKNKSVVFLLSDIHLVHDSFMPYLNDILTSGMIPDLFTVEELDVIYHEISASAEGVFEDEISETFSNRIKANLHVVLKLNAKGTKFREYILNYPALINYATIDWFERWPIEALFVIAEKFMKNINIGEPIEERRTTLCHLFSKIHEISVNYAEKMVEELNKYISINSANYLDLVQHFESILLEKTESMRNEIDRLQAGLIKIDETEAKVNIMAAELEVAKLKVSKFQKECDEYLLVISEQKKEADKNRKIVAAQSIEIEKEEFRCKKLAEAAEQDLNAVLPSLEEAKRALESLNKRDIGEIKSYPKPPVLVETVLEAVMILRESEPTWAEAKRQLSSPFFLRELVDFDKDHITDRTLEKIGKYMIKPDFKPHIIGGVSNAARSLCMWVRAMHSYGRIYRMVLPKRQRLFAAQEELRKQQEQLAEAQRKLRELEERIIQLSKEYENKLKRKEELLAEEARLEKRLRTAAELVDGLNSERGRWSKKVAILKGKLEYVIGDSILATSFVSYLGAFISTYREKLVSIWMNMLSSAGISCREKFDVADFLTTENVISEWIAMGLPSDAYSAENAVIFFRSHKWPLLIDPEGQAVKWISKMEEENGLKIIDLHDQFYMKTLQLSLAYGVPVLIQNVLTEIDPAIFPIFKKEVVCSGGELNLCGQKITCNPNFRLYLVTKLKNPNFIPDVACRTCVINFAIKEKGLEDQLLSVVVSIESSHTEEMKIQLVKDIADSKKKLLEIENTVLRLLNEAEGSLLDDIELIEALQESKRMSIILEKHLVESQKSEEEVDITREEYRPCASRGSILFFALADMSSLDHMYLFSLDPYVHQFILSIENSDASSNVKNRIKIINDYHTYAVYEFACRAMFEKHKLLLSFHMCAKILEYKGELNMGEYDFFLRGGLVLDRASQPPNPCPLWLPENCWDNITSMEELPKFMDLAISFDENSQQWHDWYMNPEPEKILLPGKWRNICNDFQKMMFIRCLRTDRLTACIATFITKNLSSRYLAPPILDMDSVLTSSDCRTPLLFIVSSGVDPVEYVQSLASKSGMKERYFALSLGQGQATFANELIEEAKIQGNWVYLANCHLLLSWMPTLETITAELEFGNVHHDFRLWLSSMPTPEFPVSVLQKCIKITMETPKGLKSNMKKLYGLIDKECIPSTEEKCSLYMKLLFALSFFHSILIERKKFQYLGWNVVYDFTEADFQVSASILSILLKKYVNTPWNAMKELIVDINYGGHVTDNQDVLLLNAYFVDYFSDETLKVPEFPLSSLEDYFIPSKVSLEAHIKSIDKWPQIEPPEVFGQNANAEVSFRIQEAAFLLKNILKIHPTKISTSKTSLDDMVLEIVADVLANTPKPIDKNTLLQSTEHPLPYYHLLLQEVYRYNDLISLIKRSLKDLVEGIKGVQIMTPAIENLFETVCKNHVPWEWSRTYPSVKALGSWIEDLKLRVQQIQDWVTNGEAPVKFWLSGFTAPKSVLIASLQVFAREGEVLLHELKWEFNVSALEEVHISERPDEGIFVRGLFLEGAGWDKKMGFLMEPEPMHLVTPMPVIHFHPVHEVNTRGHYHCPCYYIPKRTNEGTSTLVMSVDLKSNKPQSYWIKRGTALLMNLN